MTDHPCSRCGATPARPVIYGYPDSELMSQAERGEVVLGGCVLSGDEPRWLCERCVASKSDQSSAPVKRG